MPASPRRSSAFALSLVFALIASLFVAPASGAASSSAQPISHRWIAQADDPQALANALAVHKTKVPQEFYERLRWTLPDGTLRVMAALQGRDSSVESFVEGVTTSVQWYGDAPRFLARVTPDQLTALLGADVVSFVEPDYPIENFMASSSLEVHARSVSGDPTGVWSYDPTTDSLTSNIPGLSVDQATGKGVTVAITDSGIDRTHRDFGGWSCAAGPYQPCESRIVRAVSIEHMIDAGVDPGDSLPTTELASGHGTHVAGTVAGNSYYKREAPPNASDKTTYGADGYNFGVAPQAGLISTKNGDTLWAGLSSMGLQWQLEHADEYNIRVSSNSWGCIGGCAFNGSSAAAQLYRDMFNAGIVVTFAAGNDGGTNNGNAFSGDAQSPYVLGVAAYNDVDHRLASFSSRGSDNSLPNPSTWTPQSEPANGERRPDVAAPGVDIWSARTLTGGAASLVPRVTTSDVVGGGTNGIREYAVMGGTSMATPHVSGAAALMFSACPTATPLDVFRAVMASADSGEIIKTTGNATAEPFEVGYGSLEVRAGVDWLLSQPACGGTGGGDPTPDPTTEPTPDPTTTPPPPSGNFDTTKYFLHSVSGLGNTDWQVGESTFDAAAPTFDTFASYYDVPLFIGDGLTDPEWIGTIDRKIDQLEVDFWQRTPVGQGAGNVAFDVRLTVGDTVYNLPPIDKVIDPVLTDAPIRVTHKFTTMLDEAEQEVPLSIDPEGGSVSIAIRGHYVDLQSATEIVYDSTEFPSSVTVGTAVASEPQAAGTTVSFTSGSASGVQFSDVAPISAALVETDSGEPVEGHELVFELVGEAGTRSWSATTGADGTAGGPVSFDDEPGAYTLNVRFAGRDGVLLGSADGGSFVVTEDDSTTVLSVTGKGANRALTSTTSDEDAGEGLAGVPIRFVADGVQVGTATTDASGTAETALPARYRNGHHDYEAIFGGNAYYAGSSAQQTT